VTAVVPDLLAAIVGATRARVEAARGREPLEVVETRAARRKPRGRAFAEALRRPGQVNVIAECKRRSPSRGVLRAAYDPVTIARAYESAGAAAISVLTEPAFFDGCLAHLSAVRESVQAPLLRKDFIVDAYQVAEAAAAGADAILLIVASIVEVHTEEELDRAVSCGAEIVGVNNRSLKTLAVDVEVSERLAARIPATVTAVCESGLRTAADLARFSSLGYRAFLVGERFMTTPDPGAALADLLHEGSP
jgi:indole-3-glycerol phosphate synthase